ncbi:aminopeptidase P family protein [Thermodesulfobacterium sp. TA1]|uniref:M24 family metallopeptidase n=1 Tax=Thermodesulfobacterium sp. TA1 TaxID=2234087 RepID=UPI001231CAC5|nr:Xaa-Pro peptidase family protein [Thermodesulfobacterium sp. TA1]QER42437.1 aminopeptidase P family protein [Thermodesulfobacterium sp. TA1]
MNLKIDEVKDRLQRLQALLAKNQIDLALISNPINLFYFTGTLVKGFLLVSLKEVKLLVNRPWERAKKEALVPCEPLKTLKDLPLHITAFCLKGKIGIEKEKISLRDFLRYQELLGGYTFVGIDRFILEVRAVKSAYEIECIKKAGKMLDKALKRALPQLKPGMKEIDASAILEKELRLLGHPGLTRSLNGFELTYGYLISGKEGLEATHYYTGEGGKGVEGFPGGATLKKRLKQDEPILLDFSGYHQGYYIDQTRMVSFKKLPYAQEVFQASLFILNELKFFIKPGLNGEEVFAKAKELAEKTGLGHYFMNSDGDLGFVGHGVGLQIDEPPVLGKKQKMVLQENMVIALEPKFHFPGLGVIGVEETFLVTKEGLQSLTTTSTKWKILKGV